MTITLEEIIICPACGSEKLFLSDKEVKEPVTGWYICNDCHSRYPIFEGIPVLKTKYSINNLKKSWYADYSNYRLEPIDRLKDVINRSNTKRILDVGCGKGVYFPFYNGQIVGCDYNIGLLREARSMLNGKVILVCADGLNLPFKNEVFDFVVSSQVIEHLNEEDHVRFVDELTRVSCDKVVITTPNSSFLLELMRRLLEKLFGFYDTNETEEEELHHHSRLTTTKLRNLGFRTRGCLGFVTKNELGEGWKGVLGEVYDKISWYVPYLAGTIIGSKSKESDDSNYG